MSTRPAPTLSGTSARTAVYVGCSIGGLLSGVGIVVALSGQAVAAVPAAAAVVVALATSTARRRPPLRPTPMLALLDPVTGVTTRSGLEQRLGSELSRARRHGDALTVLHIDLVGFAEVNRRAGRPVGDELLRRFALGMAAVLRGEDVVGRRGGDSFIVVLSGLIGRDADRVAARLVAVAERVRHDGVAVKPLRVSIGSAAYPVDGSSVDALLAVAARRLGDARRARAVADEPSDDGQAAPLATGWRVGAALRRDLALAVPAAAAWFALPLVVDGQAARMALVAALSVTVAITAWLLAGRTLGRERLGWRVIAVASVLAFVPVVGSAAVALFGVGILVVAGDGWLRDRVRLVDAGIFAAIVCGLVATLALPDWGAVASAAPLELVVLALRALGVAMIGATALLVLTSVPRRSRPDVWMLSIGCLVVVVGAIATIHGGSGTPLGQDWRVISALAAVNGLAAIWLRAQHVGPASRALHDDHADAALAVTAGTAGFVGLMAVGVLVNGAVPAGIVVLLVVIALLRHARTRIISYDNRRLVALALRSQAERAAQHRASLVALTTAMEARDGYTGRHGAETVSLAVRVADALGLGVDERREVDTVALLHDVGKIGTPNEILHKPGPLTDDEWSVMREHPVIGERILRTVPGLEAVAHAVRHEHERWDGRGYPDGLSGEDIPLASRIVLVCDAYHAMTSDRPYRSAMPVAAALAELARHAGTQFDPAVVHALTDVLDRVHHARVLISA